MLKKHDINVKKKSCGCSPHIASYSTHREGTAFIDYQGSNDHFGNSCGRCDGVCIDVTT